MLTLLTLLLAPPAEAGCAVDDDRDERQAKAALVVRAEVVSIEVTENQGAPVVRERVRVTESLKGEVRQGGLLLRGALPRGGCPPTSLFPVGAEVYVIATPGEDGLVSISACTDDVGLDTGRVDLAAIAAAHPSSAGVVEGVSPTPPTPPRVLPDAPGQARAQVRAGDRWVDAALVRRTEAAVFIEAQLEGYTLRRAAPPTDLRPLLREDTPLTEGLFLRSGAPMTADGAADWGAGWSLQRPVSQDAIADHHLPSAQRVASPRGAPRLRYDAPLTLHAGPDSADAAVVVPVGGATLHALGLQLGEWELAFVQSDYVMGEAWVRAEDVRLVSGPEGVPGGVVGGVMGGVSNMDPLRVRLDPYTELKQPGTGATLGKVSGRGVEALWLADSAEARSVALETPWGLLVVEVPLSEAGTCE